MALLWWSLLNGAFSLARYYPLLKFSSSLGVFHLNQKIQIEILKWGQVIRKFAEKVSRRLELFPKVNFSTEILEIPEIPRENSNGMEIPGKTLAKNLLNFPKVNHSTESSGNSGRKFKWNGDSA